MMQRGGVHLGCLAAAAVVLACGRVGFESDRASALAGGERVSGGMVGSNTDSGVVDAAEGGASGSGGTVAAGATGGAGVSGAGGAGASGGASGSGGAGGAGGTPGCTGPADCDDSNPCTLDTCDVSNTCVHDGAAMNDAACNDSNAATTVDLCNAGACQGYAPVTTGLVAYYPFEGDGNDASGHGHNGAPNGSPQWVSGIKGMAFRAGGAANPGSFTVPDDNELDFDQAFSFSVWIVGSATPGGVIVSKWYSGPWPGGGENAGMGDFYTGYNGTTFAVTYADYPTYSGAAAGADSELVNDSFANATKHIVFTFDQGLSSIYVNGQLVSSHQSVLTQTSVAEYATDQLDIGRLWSNGGAYAFDGTMDELRFYNRALTPAEVLAIYQTDKN